MRQFNFQITVKNPFSGHRFHLLSFTHKGYWFYGRHRERDSMARCARLVQKGGLVFEVGGHIGYLSQFFAHRVGTAGQVHIFEPGQQNQKFLRMNIASCQQCVHVNAAVSDFAGKATFYEENLGGFMNSLDQGCPIHGQCGRAASQTETPTAAGEHHNLGCLCHLTWRLATFPKD